MRLLLLGAPGSGKGTQTTRLLKQFPSLHPLLLGDLLRNEMARQSPVGLAAAEYIRRGELVPDATMVQVVTSTLQASDWFSPSASWLLDGFPRTRPQAEALHTALTTTATPLNCVVELAVPDEVILSRITSRWIHAPSGRVYNTDYNPPKVPFTDDVTGEPLSQRPDDTEEVFRKRMATYHQQLGPLRAFYTAQGIYHQVGGDTSDVIFPKLTNLLHSQFSL